ncbi:MAG TPA: lipid-binding SYLF domain-containing protein [Gemmatales bacterium]|nr:lipid-binding SYLF domain-containing protein [Gemmatales bacterium]
MQRFGLTLLMGLVAVPSLSAQGREQERITSAGSVLTEMSRIPDRGIPTSLIHEAQAIMIFPNVIRAGFVVGVRRGHGVVMARNEQGVWGLPVMVTITGGNFGAQVGLQSSDLVLMFRTRRGVDSVMAGRQLTLGGDASISAGPIGRNLAAGTDTSFRTEILSWSRSRGLFAGVALDGSIVTTDHSAIAAVYGSPAPIVSTILNGQLTQVPQAPNNLRTLLLQMAPPPTQPPPLPPK